MKKVKLGEVATFINGYAFKPQDWSSEGKEIIRIQNLTKTSTEINYYSGTIDKKYIVEAGDILISWSGTLGVFQWCGRSAVLNQHIFKVVFDKIDIDKSYFKYVVEKGLQDAVKHTHGSTMKHLTKKYFDNIMVPYKNLGEQQRIASELDLLSKLILRRQEQLEELNLLVKSRFNEMFGDPLNNNKKFAVKAGQQCFKFSSGKFLDKHDRVFEGYPAYGGNGIAWKSRKYLIDNPTIIIGRVGAYCGNVRTTHGKVWISDNAIYIKEFKNSDFNLVFLLELMKVIDFSKFADFSGQPKITQKPLENQKYILPPLALQNEFADFVAQVDKSQYLRDHSTGATIPHLNKNILLDLQLELLGIEEQENIICILNTIKRLITKRKLQLDELNLLVKSRFNEMFGENKIFESIDNLFDIIDGDRGKNYPKSDELFSEEYCLFLNTKNVTKNGFSFDTKQFITKTKDKLLRKGKLERYDIVLTTRGTVGNIAYYDELIKYKHLRINSGMVILRPKIPNLNQKFIIHVLRNNNYSRVISGSAQPQLPITKLKKILLPLPPLALQNEFADFVAQVDKSQFACEIAIKVWRNSLKFSII
ncbi:restriction modification system DNA specificity subunit [Streptococcus pneumoniae]|nr:restriction modification system DNA specificity subunit [Streptococcus pneumoniae]